MTSHLEYNNAIIEWKGRGILIYEHENTIDNIFLYLQSIIHIEYYKVESDAIYIYIIKFKLTNGKVVVITYKYDVYDVYEYLANKIYHG